MPKILLISRCPPYPLHFGDRLIIWHLARELSQQGYQIDLLALTQSEQDHADTHHYRQFFHKISLFPERLRSQWMYLQRLLGQHYPQSVRSAWQPDMWQAIEQHLAQSDYDLVQLFGAVHVYEFAHLLKEIPTVITPYESYSLYLKRAFEQTGSLISWVNHYLARQYEKWMFTPYDRTVVLTAEDKAELLSINPNLTIIVIPNGIDLDAFTTQQIERESATILFVGNYEYPPNHDAALILATEIFPQIQAAVPEAHLQLVGNAPSQQLQTLASDTIDITGRVPSVQDYLARATIFLCPLRYGAGMKNKVLEALAMGIPTIATPLSIEGVLAQDAEHVMVASIDEMASSAIRVLQDEVLRSQLSAKGRSLIEQHYSWQSVAHQYISLYQTIS